MILSSCEGRTGYLDEGQQNTVAMLTDVEWLVVYVDYSISNEQKPISIHSAETPRAGLRQAP